MGKVWLAVIGVVALGIGLQYPVLGALGVAAVLGVIVWAIRTDRRELAAMTPERRASELEARRAGPAEGTSTKHFPKCRNCGHTTWNANGGTTIAGDGTPYARFVCGYCGARASLYRHGFGKTWDYRGY